MKLQGGIDGRETLLRGLQIQADAAVAADTRRPQVQIATEKATKVRLGERISHAGFARIGAACKLLILAGPLLARAFNAIGRKTIWIGPAGQGSAMKLAVNAYMSILIEGVAEALQLAEDLGITPAQLAGAVEDGRLDAPIADAKLHKMEAGDYAPEFPLQWALKDVDLALSTVGDDRLPLLQALSRQWKAAVDAGHGREDVSAARLAVGSSGR